MISQAISEVDKNTSVASATSSDEAIKLIEKRDFDIFVVDADIPGLGLAELLGEIKKEIPRAYILVTARSSAENGEIFREAISNGANECMAKPINNSYGDNYFIIKSKAKVVLKMLRGSDSKKDTEKTDEEPNAEPVKAKEGNRNNKFSPEIVLIAASTGGPVALDQIITKLRSDFPVPILIVQHIPANFTGNLAENLDSQSMIKVKVADNSETISAGIVYIAPGGTHMRLDAKNKIVLDDSHPINGVRPAADALFGSVAEKFKGSRILAIVLTGMGNDGKDGIIKLKNEKDCHCLAQSEKTCVVYGMPRVVVEEGLADDILDLDEIAPELESFNYIPFKG